MQTIVVTNYKVREVISSMHVLVGFGLAVTQRIDEKGLNRDLFAVDVGISIQYLAQIEVGHVDVPLHLLMLLCEFLNEGYEEHLIALGERICEENGGMELD